jgi:hypothetical protein
VGTLTGLLLGGALLAAAPAPSPAAPEPTVHELRVGPVAETGVGMELILVGSAAPCGERLKGRVSILGSVGIGVDAVVAPRPDRGCSLRFELPYSAVGPDALAKAKLPAVGWSFTGARSTNGTWRDLSWRGSLPREVIRLTEPTKATVGRFVAVKEMQIGSLGVATSTVNIDVEVKNPLAFDLGFVGAAYELIVAGRPLATGRKDQFVLRAGRASRLLLPVELSNEGVISSLWGIATGERVDGVLRGTVRLRVPNGELDFPFELPVTLSRE